MKKSPLTDYNVDFFKTQLKKGEDTMNISQNITQDSHSSPDFSHFPSKNFAASYLLAYCKKLKIQKIFQHL